MYNESSMNAGSGDEEEDVKKESNDGSPGAPKKAGRRKINIEFIEDKSRRHITFSKRKAGIMKKAYELSTLTGTQVLLLVASETGHVYTFATPKLQPLITKPEGKNLIQSCLNAPEVTPTSPTPHSAAPARIHSQAQYTEPPLLYPPNEPMYPPEHGQTSSSSYDKDDKDHRTPRNQQEMGKALHMDVAQINSHIGLAYGAPFQNPPPNMMNHAPLNNMGGMSGYPPMPARYMPTSSAGGNPNPSTNSQYANHPPYSSSVAGMLAQFPSSGFGGPSNPAYMWPNPSSSSAHSSTAASASHSENGNKPSSESHHPEENLPST